MHYKVNLSIYTKDYQFIKIADSHEPAISIIIYA